MNLGQIWFLRKDTHINFREGSFDGKLKVLVSFSRSKEIRGQLIPPTSNSLFPKRVRKNFEIAIVLKIVQLSHNKNSALTQPPRARGKFLNFFPGCI